MIKPLIHTALAALLLTCPAPLWAQTQTAQPAESWYQVELLVFSYESPDNAQQELWPRELGLHYPARIVALRTAGQSEILLNNQATIDADQEPLPATDNEPAVAPDPAAESTLSPLTVQLGEQPFTLLDNDQLSFSPFIGRLARQADIRPLFHGAWRQPISERSEAESILITGGDKFDEHYELEGSISLGLERYLHIKTDLWLSTFVSNLGREKNPWPVLPPRPVVSSIKNDTLAADPFSAATNQPGSAGHSRLFNPFHTLSGNRFAVDRTIALRQDRRMRSNELHYIDHPLLGLLVRITPYEFPVPAPADSAELEDNTLLETPATEPAAQ